jgi:hypothetical protein
MDDYRIEAATKEEWANRAFNAEDRNKELTLQLLATSGQAADALDAYDINWHAGVLSRNALAELESRTWQDIVYEHHLSIKELLERVKDLEYDRASAQTLPICELPKF